jgi:hypothetical protein
MRDQALARLDELKREYQMGEGQLRELGRQEAALRETLLRITGAIQVLEELLATTQAGAAPGPTAGPAASAAPAPPEPSEPQEEQGLRHQEAGAVRNGNRGTHEPLTVP